ncbi:hypothetical protein [Acinetobacter phage Ab69]|nr:hypothetical protein [Acinetobacter phage Ab69]
MRLSYTIYSIYTISQTILTCLVLNLLFNTLRASATAHVIPDVSS